MMSLFENNVPPVSAEAAPAISEMLSAIARIEDADTLFAQLQQAKDIPAQFLPESKDYCLVTTGFPSQTGELSAEEMDQINTFARAHIADPKHARWLLVQIWPVNSVRPQSTLVCFIQHFSPNALVDNTDGVGVANQIVAALQALQGEGLITTNVNFELIRKMSSKFGVLFGGSFSDLANSLRVHSVDQSVRKTEKVAHEKGLFAPAPAPAASPGLGGAADVAEDENL